MHLNPEFFKKSQTIQFRREGLLQTKCTAQCLIISTMFYITAFIQTWQRSRCLNYLTYLLTVLHFHKYKKKNTEMPPVRSSPLLYSKATQPRQVTITEKPAVVALLHSKSPTTASLLFFFVSNVKTEQNKNPLKLFVVFIKLKSKGLRDFYYLASLKKKKKQTWKQPLLLTSKHNILAEPGSPALQNISSLKTKQSQTAFSTPGKTKTSK